MGKHKRTIYTIFAILISFIFIPNVYAGENFISPGDFIFRQYTNNSNYNSIYATNCTDSTCYYNMIGTTYKGVFSKINGSFTINNVELLQFNMSIEQGDLLTLPISNISFLGQPCYYNLVNNEEYFDGSLSHTVASISAYCPVSRNLTITNGQPILEFNLAINDLSIRKIGLSKVKILDDNSAKEIINILNTANGYYLTHENLLIQIKDILLNNQNFTNDKLDAQIQKQEQIINSQNATNNKLDETNDNLNKVNDSVNKVDETINNNDSSEATDEAGSFFSGFETDTFGLTSIITAPLNLIQSVTSSTCVPMGLKVPFVENTTLNLPCLRGIYENNFGSFYDIYKTITFGITAYWVCVRLFNLVKDFKNPEHDEIEVLDL